MNGTSQTPNKNRSAKYDYCSPVKSVTKAAAPSAPIATLDVSSKPKKKVKLFPAAGDGGSSGGGGGKTHKSFSDVEERLGGHVGHFFPSSSSPVVVGAQISEGVFELPVTPVRNSGSRRRSGDETAGDPPASQFRKRGSGRMSPSPQTFSLGDFLVRSETRKTRSSGLKSPSKVGFLFIFSFLAFIHSVCYLVSTSRTKFLPS